MLLECFMDLLGKPDKFRRQMERIYKTNMKARTIAATKTNAVAIFGSRLVHFWPACTLSRFARESISKLLQLLSKYCTTSTAFVPCSNFSKIHTFTITPILLFYNHICSTEAHINDHFKSIFISSTASFVWNMSYPPMFFLP